MSRRAGLTLLDLLLALTLLAVILTTIYWVFANHERSVEAASESRDTYGQGRLILDRLARDIAGAWLPAKTKSNDSFSYLFNGQDNRLDFTTSALLSPDIAPGLELVEVGYRTIENEEDDDFTLVRRQDRTPDGEIKEGGSKIILTRALNSFEISYINQLGQEMSSWQAKKSSELPHAVKISLTLTSTPDRKETFTTVIALPLSWPKLKTIAIPAGWENLL
ncbi:MAG: hypothetical protein JRG97_06790 [Deltaproteobacteria bacterium]|nr:hypothetical protein [Deltaproteobacteria bacterium]MBW2052192.1 hypothetical protein [Deltaproteobacteria bacterium]MBW2140763.1 hypothetical protein [Deltaproteobacteria bacterium]